MSTFDQSLRLSSIERNQFSFDMVQRGVLWLLIAISWLVFIEPSPYEFLFIVTLLIYLPRGMSVTGVMMPFLVFLLLYNIGGVFSVIPVSDESKRVMFILTSIYMAVTAMFFAFITAHSPMQVMATIRSAYVPTAVIAAACGVMGYFDVAGTAQYFAPESRAACDVQGRQCVQHLSAAACRFLDPWIGHRSADQKATVGGRADNPARSDTPGVLARRLDRPYPRFDCGAGSDVHCHTIPGSAWTVGPIHDRRLHCRCLHAGVRTVD